MNKIVVLVAGCLFLANPLLGASLAPAKTTDDIKESKGAKRIEVAHLKTQFSGAKPTYESLARSAIRQLDGEEEVKWAALAEQCVAHWAFWMTAVQLEEMGYCCYRMARAEYSSAAEILAFKAFTVAASSGDLPALNNVAYCVEYGIGVKKDEKQAVALYQKIMATNPAAKDNYARCLREGKVVARDEKKALQLYQEAAEAGCAQAMFHCGCCYLALAMDQGDEALLQEAVAIILKGACAGVKDACSLLYRCYRDGCGVKQDKTEALKWLVKSGHRVA